MKSLSIDNTNNSSENLLLICGSQEQLYVTANHLPYISKNKGNSFVNPTATFSEDDLDIGDVSDTKPAIDIIKKQKMAHAHESGKKFEKQVKNSKPSKGFTERKKTENADFFKDLFVKEEDELELVDN